MQNLTQILKSGLTTTFIIGAAVMSTSTPAMAGTSLVRMTIDAEALMTARGVERVYDKITQRAEAECGVDGLQSIPSKGAAQLCVNTLVDELVTNIGHTALSELHAERTMDG